MAVLVRSCCCGCSLRAGVLVIAVLGLIGGGYGIYSNFRDASALSENRDGDVSLLLSAKQIQVSINLMRTSGVFNILVVLTSICIFGACSLKNRFLVLPYLVLHIILLGYSLGVIIYYSAVWGVVAAILFIVPAAIGWSLSIYFLIVVYSFHEAFREDPSGVTAGFLPDSTSGSAPKANIV
ncbi:uncharacterized protein LOC114976690 [Acropora millepora]|uniref:uncharacterized protein LOC114976690 n=1 Tax=Acropora millepora TaxID=45264 RepID=UPI001CF22E46|nr:uncharacterized protein LOC114976690 [Acropora millepora]